MAEAKGRKSEGDGGDAGESATTGAAPQTGATRMGIRLVPAGNSDQPVVANYTALNTAPGMAFIDFGFLEPGMLTALPRVAGRKWGRSHFLKKMGSESFLISEMLAQH